MASNEFSIPFAPLDFSAITNAIQGRRANARADAYLEMERDAVTKRHERESAALARQKEQDKYNRDVAAFNAVPELQRRARRSPGEANINPFGIQFEQGEDLPAGFEGPEPSPAAEAARFMMNPQAKVEPPKAVPTPEVPGALPQGVEGPSETPEGEAARFDKDAEPERLMGRATENTEPVQDLMTQAAKNAMGPQKRLFMTYGGNRTEVPAQEDESTGFGEEYDSLYKRLVDLGEKPHDALKTVAGQFKSDQLQMALSGRQGRQLDFKDRSREDIQTFQREENEKYKSTHGQKLELIDRAGKYKVAASAPTLKIDTANRQDMGALRAGFKEWKNTVNLSIDSKSHKRLATAMANLESGNAMQEREAAESLVAIFKGGGQVTKASQDLLLKHLAGIVGDVQTWLQHLETGNFGAMELNVLKTATRNALKEEQEKLHAYHESAVDTFGPGSGWEQLGGNVNAMVKGAFKQFGYDAPSVYPENAEPVVLGSGQRPKPPSKKTSAQAPQTVTIRNKKTGETKQVSLEEARKMGAAP